MPQRRIAMLRSHSWIVLSFAAAAIGVLSGQTDAKATNNLPDPFRPVEDWAQLPAGMEWGQVISVQPDAKGNIWIFHRKDLPILAFNSTGKLLKSFGAG